MRWVSVALLCTICCFPLCAAHDDHDHDDDLDWGMLSLALSLVFATSLVVAAVPKSFVIKHNRKLIALSIGALFGTLFFELIPHTMHIAVELVEDGHDDHDHDHDDHDHDHDSVPSVPSLGVSSLLASAVAALPESVPSMVAMPLQDDDDTHTDHDTHDDHDHDHDDHEHDSIFRTLSGVMLGGVMFGFIIESLAHATSGGHSHGHRGCGDECEELDRPDEFHSSIPNPSGGKPRPLCDDCEEGPVLAAIAKSGDKEPTLSAPLLKDDHFRSKLSSDSDNSASGSGADGCPNCPGSPGSGAYGATDGVDLNIGAAVIAPTGPTALKSPVRSTTVGTEGAAIGGGEKAIDVSRRRTSSDADFKESGGALRKGTGARGKDKGCCAWLSCGALRALPILVIVDFFAKTCHHFADGALIGSLFSAGTSAGWSVTIAIIAHELSSQLGQFAMYVALGVSKHLAIFIGACNTLSVFFGGFLLAGLKDQLESSGVLDYIPTFAAGLFLYLTLADLTPLLLHSAHGTHGSQGGDAHAHGGHFHGQAPPPSAKDVASLSGSESSDSDGEVRKPGANSSHANTNSNATYAPSYESYGLPHPRAVLARSHSHADVTLAKANGVAAPTGDAYGHGEEKGMCRRIGDSAVLFFFFAVGLVGVSLILNFMGHSH